MKRPVLVAAVSSFCLFLCGTAHALSWNNVAGPSSHGAISIGANGNGDTWIVSDEAVVGDSANNHIYRYNGATWDSKPNAARQITVSRSGTPWVLRADGSIWRWNGSSFDQSGGIGSYNGGSSCAKAIAVGFDTSVGSADAWIVSCGTGADPAIFRWSGSAWVQPSFGGNATYLGLLYDSSASLIYPWAVQSGGSIYVDTGSSWVAEGSGGGSITGTYSGTWWVLNTAQNKRYIWSSSSWAAELAAPSGKTLKQLAAEWAITTDGNIYFSL